MRPLVKSGGCLGLLLFLVGWINTAVFQVEASYRGGTPSNGETRDGHYLLGDRAKRVEVSAQVWKYMRAREISEEITFPLGLFLGVGLMLYAGAAHEANTAQIASGTSTK